MRDAEKGQAQAHRDCDTLQRMKVGLLSDTHGRFAIAERAARTLLLAGAKHLVHAGDVGDGVLDALAIVGLPVAFVFGNNDFDRATLRKHAELLGMTCLGEAGTIEVAGKRIAVTHGDVSKLVDAVIGAQSADYLITGHTHVRHDLQAGTVRRINPGALHRAQPKTAAVIDLETGVLEWFTISEF
jgi:uncharacterized protein